MKKKGFAKREGKKSEAVLLTSKNILRRQKQHVLEKQYVSQRTMVLLLPERSFDSLQ